MHKSLLMVAASFVLCQSLGVLAREVPQNLRNFVSGIRNNGKGQCKNILKGGFNSQDDDSSDFCYCGTYYNKYGVVYLQGPKGQLVNMDVDCDGDQRKNRPGNDGRCGASTDTQSGTSFDDIVVTYPNSSIKSLNAFVHTYVVFGNEDTDPDFDPQKYGIKPLSIIAVVCGNNLVYGVWGDTNGDDGDYALVGEASIGLATLCYGKKNINGNAGHDANDVFYLAFKGMEAVPGAKAKWNAQSATEFEASLASLGDKLVKRIGT